MKNNLFNNRKPNVNFNEENEALLALYKKHDLLLIQRKFCLQKIEAYSKQEFAHLSGINEKIDAEKETLKNLEKNILSSEKTIEKTLNKGDDNAHSPQ